MWHALERYIFLHFNNKKSDKWTKSADFSVFSDSNPLNSRDLIKGIARSYMQFKYVSNFSKANNLNIGLTANLLRIHLKCISKHSVNNFYGEFK